MDGLSHYVFSFTPQPSSSEKELCDLPERISMGCKLRPDLGEGWEETFSLLFVLFFQSGISMNVL